MLWYKSKVKDQVRKKKSGVREKIQRETRNKNGLEKQKKGGWRRGNITTVYNCSNRQG